MAAENNKYEKILNMLRKSQPEMTEAGTVTEKIMRKLQDEKSRVTTAELIIEFMFGWIYIGWFRKAMVVAVIAIALLFGYQQALILRKISELSGHQIQDGSPFMTSINDDLINKIRILKISGGKFSNSKISVSKKEIDEMITSINKLQIRYKDVIKMIEDDPELKQYVERKMNETGKLKTKIQNYE